MKEPIYLDQDNTRASLLTILLEKLVDAPFVGEAAQGGRYIGLAIVAAALILTTKDARK